VCFPWPRRSAGDDPPGQQVCSDPHARQPTQDEAEQAEVDHDDADDMEVARILPSGWRTYPERKRTGQARRRMTRPGGRGIRQAIMIMGRMYLDDGQRRW
jgi:hypothetical protein